jgi:ATP-dependent Clp protease, protease subunit
MKETEGMENMEIPAKAPIVYISFSAEINPSTTESLIALMSECANKSVLKVYLLLSTPGGSVMHGFNLYNILQGMPFELITHNAGNVDSIGNVVFLAGTKRYATSSATFMFHGVGFNIEAQQRLEEKFLRERLDGLMSDQKRIGTIICKHTKITDSESEKLFLEAQTKDASFAINKGIIDEIKDIQISAGAPIFSLVFKR